MCVSRRGVGGGVIQSANPVTHTAGRTSPLGGNFLEAMLGKQEPEMKKTLRERGYRENSQIHMNCLFLFPSKVGPLIFSSVDYGLGQTDKLDKKISPIPAMHGISSNNQWHILEETVSLTVCFAGTASSPSP